MFFEKSTPCGRFTVTIETQQVGGPSLLRQDAARSAKDLSDICAEASRLALELAVSLLEAGRRADAQ